MNKRLIAFCIIAIAVSLMPAALFAQQGSAGYTVVVGTATPSGSGFDVTLDADAVASAYPVLAGARMDTSAFVRQVAIKKLKEWFPQGVPPDASKIQITITISLTRPPEIGLSIQC